MVYAQVSTYLGLLHFFVFISETGVKADKLCAYAYASKRTKARHTLGISSRGYNPHLNLTGILLVPGLVTSFLLDLSPMRDTHKYGYSGLRIDGQIPGRILDVGDDSKLSNSEMATWEW
jgi:hypothetical protein